MRAFVMSCMLGVMLIGLFVPVALAGEVTSKYDVNFYGFLKFETFYDNSLVKQGDWLLYCMPDDPNADDKVFSMNARHSRIGFDFTGPAGDGLDVKAKLEADFAGGFPNSSTAARQPILRLRHAWVQLGNDKWEARFGQDWALIAGPFPNTTSFVVGAGKGNLWMRYPQARFTYKMNPLKMAVSVNRPMAGNIKYNDNTGGDFDMVGDGELSGLPWFMGRVWYTMGATTFSVSGHTGVEKIKDLAGDPHDMTSYSANVDVVTKVGPFAITLRGFMGENLNSFFGGVFQGYVAGANDVTNIASMGGWGQVMYTMNESWKLGVGGGFDDPDEADLADCDIANDKYSRDRNDWFFGNVTYTYNPAVSFMLEGEYLKTSYMDDVSGAAVDPGDNLRIMFVTYYKF